MSGGFFSIQQHRKNQWRPLSVFWKISVIAAVVMRNSLAVDPPQETSSYDTLCFINPLNNNSYGLDCINGHAWEIKDPIEATCGLEIGANIECTWPNSVKDDYGKAVFIGSICKVTREEGDFNFCLDSVVSDNCQKRMFGSNGDWCISIVLGLVGAISSPILCVNRRAVLACCTAAFFGEQKKSIQPTQLTFSEIIKKYSKEIYSDLTEEERKEFVCPILNTIMENPVILTASGLVYEEKAIARWLIEKNYEPVTKVRLRDEAGMSLDLVPNDARREKIHAWVQAWCKNNHIPYPGNENINNDIDDESIDVERPLLSH